MEGGLIHVGRTGTGFTGESARDQWKRLKPLRVDAPPFATPLNTLQKRDAVWVRPESSRIAATAAPLIFTVGTIPMVTDDVNDDHR